MRKFSLLFMVSAIVPALALPASAGLRPAAPERVARPGLMLRAPERTTGGLTGLIKGITGAPFGGVCVLVTGPAGSDSAISHLAVSHSNGRYLLANLRPGRYALSITTCGQAGHRGPLPPLSVAWPGQPAPVTVLTGVLRTLGPATAWPTSDFGTATGRPLTRLAATKTGSISGRVTGNGHPLARICAVAIPADLFSQSRRRPHAVTSKTGRYRITGVRPGQYLVVFRTGIRSCPDDANWLPQWYPLQNSADPPQKAVVIRVRTGRDTTRINGRLRLGGEITGIVRARSGRPVSGVCVNFSSEGIVGGLYVVYVAAVSRRTGRYALHGLFPGSYLVQFSIGCGGTGNYAPQWWRDKSAPGHANSIKITGKRIVRGIDAALRPGAAITGTVRAKTARATPLAGVCVFASGNVDNADVSTAKNGTYRLVGLVGGKYQVTFDPTCLGAISAGYLAAQRSVSVTAGHTRSGVNAFLRPAAGISGVVRNSAGHPVDSVCVNIDDGNNDGTFTGANGRYSLDGVAPGRHAVDFETDCGSPGSLAPQWYNDRPDSDSANLVTFTAGQIDRNIDATLHPGGTVAGVLTSTTGRPISGECVAVVAQDGSLLNAGFSIQADSAGNGRYVAGDLAPGTYQISFNCETGRYADEWFRSEPDATKADVIAVNPGVITTVDEKLSRAGIIKGTVTDKAGRPIPDICVNVANAQNGQLIPPIDNGAMTDHGHYQIGQLAPGRYLVQFADCNGDVYGAQWYRHKNSESFATPVTVRSAQATVGIDDVLTVGGSIAGTATGPAGKPATDMCVFANDPAAGQFSDLFFVGTHGGYKVTGLATGRYSLTFAACSQPGPNLGSITLPKPVPVTAPKPVTGVNVKLAAGGSITGVLTGNAALPGPLDQACVVAEPASPNDSFPVAWTGASGRYVLDGLAAGTYRVDLADPYCDEGSGGGGLAPQWYHGAFDQATATLVTVSAGRTTSGISATLRPYGGIEGLVTTARHGRVAGECVTAIPFDASADPASGLAPPPDVAISQATGRYRLLDLLPGRYQVEFTSGCGDAGFAPQWWDDAVSARSARVITVKDATITGINAALRR